MRALADFIMRGRAQAAIIALAGAFVPLLSPSAVALVSLRRGGVDGSLVFGWAILPAIVMAVASPETLPMAFYSLCVLVAVSGGAMLLRKENSWPLSVLSLVALSAVGGLVYGWTFPEFNQALVDQLNEAQAQALEQLQEPGLQPTAPVEMMPTLVVGLIAALVAFNALLALVIGRWWQATLYNPGGFRAEFHDFRLDKNPALLCFGLAAICVSRPNLLFWGFLTAMPLFLVTASVVHNRVYARRMGLGWLVLFYLLMLFQPLFLIAACVGLSDSWVNYRQRIGPQAPQGKPDE